MITRLFTLSLFFSFALPFSLFSQNITLSGYVKDAQTGETLIGVNVYDKEKPSQGASTNNYGFYSLTLPKGTHTIRVSFVGYTEKEVKLDLTENKSLNFELTEGVEMQEVVITAEEKDKNVTKTEMGTVALSIETIKKTAVLFGENDVLKVIQLLPGVKSMEGSSGFYVRGGGIDQNLVLLDEAVVYNPGHMLGFFSVFNSDAIKNTTLIKGGMPPQYGGRLSSVLDIQMKEGNDKTYAAEGGIGLISSRLTFEGPIVKEKASFVVSARRTYGLDLAQPFINKTRFAGSNYYFYDLNTKVNYRISDKDRLFLSGYFGRDFFILNSKEQDFKFELPYGNSTATLRWNHLFSPKLFMNVSAIYNDYNFTVNGGQDIFKFGVQSSVRDYNGKIAFEYFPSSKHSIKYGIDYTYHRLSPNVVTATNGEQIFTNSALIKPKYAHEAAFYFGDDWKATSFLTLNFGARYSTFQQVGPYTSPIDAKTYATGERVKLYTGFEPRLTGTLKVSKVSSVKFGTTLTTQYLHLVSNSTSTLPGDVWVPSSELVKPQRGVQYAVGYFQNFADNMFEVSIEGYWKNLRNQLDYAEGTVPDAATNVESNFVSGKGKAYGVELFVKKSKGKLNGWVGYTWSRTLRQFDDINNGKVYPSVYDRIHDIVVVANYSLSKKWDFTANFVYGTGNAFTPLRTLYFIDQSIRQEYAARNSSRLPNYHRMDIGATYSPTPKRKNFSSTWSFSVYNAYNRLNPFFVYYDVQGAFEAGKFKATANQVTLFPIIPSVTWNFKWNQAKK